MNKKDISIAILDIDSASAQKMKAEIEKAGYSVFCFSDHDQLIGTVKLRKFDLIFIECLTQKASLDNIVGIIQKEATSTPKFIFMSFVLDKSSAKDAMIKTKSQHFFKKPIDTKVVVELLSNEFADLVTEELAPTSDILTKDQATHSERLEAVRSMTEIHGFDVPRALAYLMKAQFSGILKFKSSQVKPIEIHLKSGAIVKAVVDDPKSFFGALLVDKNFISVEMLETTLQQKSSKRIGERLVDANLVSPHVIDIINAEQLGIRVGYLIKNTSYELEISEQNITEDAVHLESQDYQRFLSDWLHSKFTLTWLKTFYMPWMENKISKTKFFADISPIHNLAPLNRMPKFAQILTQGANLTEILDQKTFKEEDVLIGVHMLIVNEFICFDKQVKPVDNKALIERLSKIKADMDLQNHFEVLGLSDKAKSKEIKKSYYELSKLFHPDKVSPQAPKEVLELTNNIFAKISKAYEMLGEDESRLKYLKELEKGFAEKILESESLFEEGKSFLKSNQPQKAIPLLEKAMSLRPPTAEIRLHYLWGKILIPQAQNVESYLKDIESDLNRIPPEDRHNTTYYFVKGLYLKQIGDLEQAEKNMKQALSMQSNNVEAKRELNIISLQKKSSKPVDIMNADLKDVVGMLFKKKK